MTHEHKIGGFKRLYRIGGGAQVVIGAWKLNFNCVYFLTNNTKTATYKCNKIAPNYMNR
jgi:hypothetical protein